MRLKNKKNSGIKEKKYPIYGYFFVFAKKSDRNVGVRRWIGTKKKESGMIAVEKRLLLVQEPLIEYIHFLNKQRY